jgi:hypothetical protein
MKRYRSCDHVVVTIQTDEEFRVKKMADIGLREACMRTCHAYANDPKDLPEAMAALLIATREHGKASP